MRPETFEALLNRQFPGECRSGEPWNKGTEEIGDIKDITVLPALQGKQMAFRRVPRFLDVSLGEAGGMTFLYMYNGIGRMQINGIPRTITGGQGILLDQNTDCRVSALGEGDILIQFLFSDNYLREIGTQIGVGTAALFRRFARGQSEKQSEYLLIAGEESTRLPFLIRELCCEMLDPGKDSEAVEKCLLSLIGYELGRYAVDFGQVLAEEKVDAKLIPVLEYIRENYQSVTLGETAKNFHVNPNYLSTVIKKSLGYSFRELVIRQRIYAAKNMLAYSEQPISEIARHVGYDNTTFFYKKYREVTGESPSDFRKRKN